jgi:DNA polymerase-3 subunit delta'
VPTTPLFGHSALRERLRRTAAAGQFPGSILLSGPAGIGKQRLAVWIGQMLLCEAADAERRPCGACRQCRYSVALTHPDLHWIFPRPRLKDSDPSLEDIREDRASAIAQRVADDLLYAPPTGSDGIFVASIRATVRDASLAPALARRKAFIVGDAERMVPQEGAEQAANAFLKLLEEPPADTTIVLTSSEPGALLPTIRSRVIAFRVQRLDAADMNAFLSHPLVAARFESAISALRSSAAALQSFVQAGAPGALMAGDAGAAALDRAREFLAAAADGRRADVIKASFALGTGAARGAFSDFLDALSLLAHGSMQASAERGDAAAAERAAIAVLDIERARELASGNITPQLLGMHLSHSLRGVGL